MTVLSVVEDARRATANSHRLAIVIVTYNSADALPGLLDTIAAGLEGVSAPEIIIADNASSDRSVEIAEAHPVGARVVRVGSNKGYAGGINAALSTIKDSVDVLILNPDIRLSRGVVSRLISALRYDAVGIVAPHILHEDGTLYHSLRREPSLLTAWSDALLGTKLGGNVDRGECVCDSGVYGRSGPVDWASGAALAISAEARRKIGPWDETFFLYSEEVDYQRRARAAGYVVAYAHDAVLVHFGGDYRSNPRLYAILTANRIRDYARHHGAAATAFFRLAVVTGEGLRSLRGSAVHRAGMWAALSFKRRQRGTAIAARENAYNG